MGDRFFFYGTLMDAGVRRLVLGPAARALAVRPAVLDGWRRALLRGRHYPAVVAAPGAAVAGVVSAPLGAAAVARLDRFEGAEYLRRSLVVGSADGDVAAWVYVARNPALASPRDWDFDTWIRRDRDRFLKRLAGGMR